jgi:hypothetical protein
LCHISGGRRREWAEDEQQSGNQDDWYRHRRRQLGPTHRHGLAFGCQALSSALGAHADCWVAGCAEWRLAGRAAGGLVGGMLSLSLCGCHEKSLLSYDIAAARRSECGANWPTET